jgi:enoyl-CoA hydratase/carnithine racemase
VTGEPSGTYEHVVVTRDGPVTELRLHSGGGPLAWSNSAHRELGYVFEDVARDLDPKVVILTGTGDSFCARIDMDTFLGVGRTYEQVWWEGKRLLENLLRIDVPVIGAINGPATVHAELALLSDIVLAADTTVFADEPHFTKGVVPGDGVHLVWTHLLGPNRGRYFLLTGETIDVEEARRLGVVSEILPPDRLHARAWELATQLAAKPSQVLRYTRAALTMQLRQLLASGLSHGLALEGVGLFTAEL